MSKPRVFISSTFYDLRQIRIELDKFIESIGYEPVRNEEGDIPYGKEQALQDYCYKEIENVDILVSIIGGRFGSASDDNLGIYSVSNKELKVAYELNKQVFIFIEKNVYTEYETFLLNKINTDIVYKYADNVNIYKFIEEIKGLKYNNNIKAFETVDDITHYLKEQLAGLFKQYIIDNERSREYSVIVDINSTAKILYDLVDLLKKDNADKESEISRIIRVNHPFVKALKEALGIKYNLYIEGMSDFKYLMKAYGYESLSPIDNIWTKIRSGKKTTITFDSSLFKDDILQYMNPLDWKDKYLSVNTEDIEYNLPF